MLAAKGPRHNHALHQHAERNALRLGLELVRHLEAAGCTTEPLLAVASLACCKWCVALACDNIHEHRHRRDG